MKQRPYEGAHDLELLQNFNADCIAAADGCGYLHPGDIAHHMFNGNRYTTPAEITTIWEDSSGIAAWVMLGPRHMAYDAQVRHDLRGSEFEREVLDFADHQQVESMKAHGIESEWIYGDAFRCDLGRITNMEALGWVPDDDAPYVQNRARIADLPDPQLPEGYTIRPAAGVEEAAQLAALHLSAFPGATWTEDQYRYVMESPGYDPARELVAISSEGQFAAFAMTWHDHINRTGLLEGVGTHADHRQRGLGRAVVTYAAHHMAAAGMEYATVCNSGSNKASEALYRSAGFEPWHYQDGYKRSLPL